jgi:hypothetical protein
MQMPKGDLLKNLLKKFGYKGAAKAEEGAAGMGEAFAQRARQNAADFGGDEGMAAFGHRFTPGSSSGSTFEPTMGPGAGMGGGVGPANQMRAFSDWEILKQKLANMTPAQKAALLSGGGGLAAGGLGGYLMGDDGQ